MATTFCSSRPTRATTRDYDTPANVVRFGPRPRCPANGSRRRSRCRRSRRNGPRTLSTLSSRRCALPRAVRAAARVGARLRAHEYPTVATFHRSGDGPALATPAPLLRHLGDASRRRRSPSAPPRPRRSSERRASTSDVLFNGFETERFVTSPRERSDETVLFFVGRLEERKGVAHAIEATREHNAKERKPWRLVIAG